jgi:hypothetical protein
VEKLRMGVEKWGMFGCPVLRVFAGTEEFNFRGLANWEVKISICPSKRRRDKDRHPTVKMS